MSWSDAFRNKYQQTHFDIFSLFSGSVRPIFYLSSSSLAASVLSLVWLLVNDSIVRGGC